MVGHYFLHVLHIDGVTPISVFHAPPPQVHQREIGCHLKEHGSRKHDLARSVRPMYMLETLLHQLLRDLLTPNHLSEIAV